MKYMTFDHGNLTAFDAVGFLEDYSFNKAMVQSLEERIQDIRDYSMSVRYDGDRVQTSGISDPTAELATLSVNLEEKKLWYEFWLQQCDKSLALLQEDDRFLLKVFYIDKADSPVYVAMDKLGMEKSNVYRLRKAAIQKFSDLMVGKL